MSITKRILESKEFKRKFIIEVMRDDAIEIELKQNKIANEWNLFESGSLKSSIKRAFSVASSGDGAKMTLNYVKYIRFLDMSDIIRKKRGGFEIYNRILFGITYKHTIQLIRFGFTDQIIARYRALNKTKFETSG